MKISDSSAGCQTPMKAEWTRRCCSGRCHVECSLGSVSSHVLPWPPGFPDDELEGPASMKEVLSDAVVKRSNQYPSLLGIPELRAALARHSKVRRQRCWQLLVVETQEG